MWSAQAVRDSKINHTQRHLSALRGTRVGWHWKTHISKTKEPIELNFLFVLFCDLYVGTNVNK